jgi:hypothetical protein
MVKAYAAVAAQVLADAHEARGRNTLPNFADYYRLVSSDLLAIVLSIPIAEVFDQDWEKWMLNAVLWVHRHEPAVHLINVTTIRRCIRETSRRN